MRSWLFETLRPCLLDLRQDLVRSNSLGKAKAYSSVSSHYSLGKVSRTSSPPKMARDTRLRLLLSNCLHVHRSCLPPNLGRIYKQTLNHRGYSAAVHIIANTARINRGFFVNAVIRNVVIKYRDLPKWVSVPITVGCQVYLVYLAWREVFQSGYLVVQR